MGCRGHISDSHQCLIKRHSEYTKSQTNAITKINKYGLAETLSLYLPAPTLVCAIAFGTGELSINATGHLAQRDIIALWRVTALRNGCPYYPLIDRLASPLRLCRRWCASGEFKPAFNGRQLSSHATPNRFAFRCPTSHPLGDIILLNRRTEGESMAISSP